MGTPAPDAVKRLVDRFDQNRDAYHSVSYNELRPIEDADGRQLTAYRVGRMRRQKQAGAVSREP